MNYTDQEALFEILKRSEAISREKARRSTIALSSVSGALFVFLVALIALIPGRAAGGSDMDSVYGSFILNAQAGGYVLAAVIAFALGITVTLLCLRLRKNSGSRNGAENDSEKEEHT